MGLQHLLDVLRHDINFDIDRIPWHPTPECGHFGRMWDHGHRECAVSDVDNGQAHTVHGHRTLLYKIGKQAFGNSYPQIRNCGDNFADTVDVALDKVSTKSL